MRVLAGKDAALGAALAIGSAFVFAPATQHAFLNFDDDYYVVDNPALAGGLTLPAVRWAFTTDFGGN